MYLTVLSSLVPAALSGGIGPDATQQQAVELLNSIGLAAGANDKVDLLKALLELVVHKQPALLPEFLPHVLELQCDPAAVVRKYLPEFVDAAIAAAPSPTVLTPALSGLRGLTGDATPAVAKRALGSCYTSFRAAYVVLALRGASATGADWQSLRELWAAARELKAAVLQLISTPGGNDAVRLAAAKFLEQAALLLTAESVPAVTGVSPAAAPLPPGNSVFSKADLVKEAEAALAGLVAILRLKLGGPDASGPLAITAIKAAGTLAQQRPQFIGRLLLPLLVLANSGEYKLDGSGGVGSGGGVQSSIAAALKSALAAVSKCQHPTAVPWHRKVADGLRALGSSAPAGENSSSSSRDGKRPRAEEPNASKRPKLEPTGQQQHHHQAAEVALGMKPAPVPMQRMAPPVTTAMLQPAAAAPASLIGQAQQLPAGALLPLPTPLPQLAQVQQVALALIAGQDAQTLAAFLSGLQPAVLADLVLALLHSLPPREALPPESAPLDHWVQQLLALLGTAALPPLPAPVSLQQQQPKAEVSAAAPPIVKAKAVPPLRLPPGALAMRLEPVLLTAAQEQELRREAVLRILRTEKVPSHHLRAALVARLAASSTAETDGLAAEVVKQLLIVSHSVTQRMQLAVL